MISPAAPLLEYLLQPLDQWLNADGVEDIAIQEPQKAWIYHHGGWQGVDVPFSLDDLEEIAILAGSLRKQEVGSDAPLCATELPGGQRLQICLPPTVPAGTVSLSIRKHEASVFRLADFKKRYVTEGWNKWRNARADRGFDEVFARFDQNDPAGFLEVAVRDRLNILLAAPTGVGKTTLSKSALAEIDHKERLITIEDTVELQILQPNAVRLLYSKDDLSGTHVTAEDLLQASLRLRPDRVLLQELRDDAAWTYLTSICSGHPGSVTTIHGRDAADAFRRLFLLVKGSESGRALERETIIDLISASIDVVVPMFRRNGEVAFGAVWFVADAMRRGETAGDLLRSA